MKGIVVAAKTCLAALLLCAGCSAQGPWSIFDVDDEGGRRPGPRAIAGACDEAEGRPPRNPDSRSLGYVVRDPYCTSSRSGPVECRFELGEAEAAYGEKQVEVERRVGHWRRARARFVYGERHLSDPNGDSWLEIWTAVGRCRPLG